MTYEFSRAGSADEPALLDLFDSAYGKKFSASWWRWYNQCPNGRNRTYVAATEQRQVVASYSLMPAWLKLGDRIAAASLANNACTAHAHRGHGLFVGIGRYALAREKDFGVRMSVGMPNPRAVPGHLRVGWKVVVDLPSMAKQRPAAAAHRCLTVDRFDGKFSEFLMREQEKYSFTTVKDRRWLDWRFADRPERSYQIFALEVKGEVEGYAVVKHFDGDGLRKSHILEVQASCDEALADLLAAAEDCSAGRDVINLWTSDRDPRRRTLEALGYTAHESTDKLIFHTNYGEEVVVPDGPLLFSFSDNDVY